MSSKIVVCALALAFATSTAWADMRFDPKPTKDVSVPYTVKVGDGESQLLIPKNMLRDLRAAIDEESGERKAQTPTLVAGVMLALSFGFGGVWIARYRGQLTRKSLILALAALTMFGSAALADRAIGGKPRPAADTPKIKVVLTDKGDAIQIVVSKKALEQLNK